MRNHPVINFLLFTCFLVIGYTLSIRFYQPEPPALGSSTEKVTTEHQDAMATLENGQRSILLVGADEINSDNPQLASLWLVSYLPENATVQFLPIYTAGGKAASSFESQLELSFHFVKVNKGLQLAGEFLSLLEDHNYWWSGYFVYDEVALAKAEEMLGATGDNAMTSSELAGLPGIPGDLEDRGVINSSLVSILQSICQQASGVNTKVDMQQLISVKPSHILTDLDASQLQVDLEEFSDSSQSPTCRFPTLEISRVEP